jgi:NitT/TauT family transport system permease protein
VEAATLYRLSGWQRFTQLELPAAMVGLIWNAMMSFGGGWFFVAASEAISVLNQEYTLPGLGSYVEAAIQAEDLPKLGWAILTMAVVILLVDQLFWRPLVAWSDKFRLEQSAGAAVPESWLYDLLTTARIPRLIGRGFSPLAEGVDRLLAYLTRPRWGDPLSPEAERRREQLLTRLSWLAIGGLGVWIVYFVSTTVGFGEVMLVFGLGILTLLRVSVLLALATVVWTPIGVAIGFNPRLAKLLQPVVQFLAAFPANFLFPFATLLFIRAQISIEWGSILLMSLGAQWYILFNSIAGAQSIPTDLREMAMNLGLRGWKLWQKLIIPGIFPAWVTGGITASGGAWNASIVSEIVTWGATTLKATGLGTYIAEATAGGDWPRITLGIGMMSLFVVGINRLFWRRLYQLAEEKYHL